MQDTGWGPWIGWQGGEPPVPEGTLVESMSMIRLEDLARSKPPYFVHVIFRVQNGDSFRLEPLLKQPGKERLLLVYRYRVWRDATSIHSAMPAEVQADRPMDPVRLKSAYPERLIEVLASVYDIKADLTDDGVIITDDNVSDGLLGWVRADWQDLIKPDVELDLPDLSAECLALLSPPSP